MRSNYSESEIAAIAAPAKPKVATLFDLIEQAKRRGGKKVIHHEDHEGHEE